MAKIILDVPDNHLNNVLNVIKSLKSELITKVQTEDSTIQPISSSLPQNEKYRPKATPIQKSRSRYLSPEEFKKRLTGKN
ncbi:hypothetical protein [Candidatus Marinarcus aquaticus]|uniref:Uncharacterized protein n=1 Tax=Candidatus Marinarcus aquaticus TaxID=2044504 RepID=A0A4Q0XTE2_9BACT|nr:hypothetical protein [Candidatus Marinarcus aquaticus]RXJ60622.1 hypothetical protein CRV04_01015 [Candidatus Marinarcus aquaticus]